MLLPSVVNVSESTIKQQKKSAASDLPSAVQQAPSETHPQQTTQNPNVEKIDDKSSKQEQLQELPSSAFSTESTEIYPDYTLELSSNSTSPTGTNIPELKPDEVRYGRKRPALPITFSFGIKRSQAVAVAMRHPLLEGKQPTTAAQAILDTLDLAATNRLLYVKGSEINLVA